MDRFLGVLLVVFLMAGCAATRPESREIEARLDPDQVQRLTVAADSYFFDPDHVVVKAGIPVELTFVRESALVPHSIVLAIPEAGLAIDEPISRSGTVVRFTPTVTGTYIFFCGEKLPFVASHRVRGMRGTLEVRP